jgi:deazaflavin-dependent oxidoreductase (nitroreductase family)
MSDDLPRKGSTMYNIMKADKIQRKKTIKQFKFWNKWFIIPLYRINILPIFFAGKIFLLLKTVGRKSGIDRYSPLEYRRRGEDIYLFSSRGKYADWYRNLVANVDKVRVKKGFRWYDPKIEIVEDIDKKRDIMTWYVDSFPGASKMLFGWDKQKDSIENTDLDGIAGFIEIVKLNL